MKLLNNSMLKPGMHKKMHTVKKIHTVKKLNITLLKQLRNCYPYLRCVVLFICLCLVLFIQMSLLTGCGNQGKHSSPEHQSSEGEGQFGKIPDSLEEMEENIEKIIGILDDPIAIALDRKEMMNSQNSGIDEEAALAKKPGQQEIQGKNKNADDSQGEAEGNSNNSSQDKQDVQDKQANKDSQKGKVKDSESNGENNQDRQQGENMGNDIQGAEAWEEITVIVNKMHYTWNSYLPETLKMGTSQKSIDDFSNALNNLTNVILSKNKLNTLMAANSLYAYIPDLFASYKVAAPSEIKRLRYYARNAVLNSLAANWSQAEEDVGNLISTWSILKNMISEEQQDTKSKLDYSILELEKVVKEKNQPLTDIKGRITLSNIMELEESFPS